MLDDRHRKITPWNVSLEEHLAVVREGGHQGRGDVRGGPGELDPQGRSLASRFDNDRKPQSLLDGRQRSCRTQFLERRLIKGEEVGRGNAGVAHRVLGQDLVGGPDAGGDARSGVRDPHRVEQLLDGAVLAVSPVERYKRQLGALDL